MWVVEVSVANAVGLQQRLVETSVFVQRKDRSSEIVESDGPGAMNGGFGDEMNGAGPGREPGAKVSRRLDAYISHLSRVEMKPACEGSVEGLLAARHQQHVETLLLDVR